jgi:hypothetical protein
VVVVLGLDESDGEMLVIEHVISALSLATCNQLAAHDDAAFGETDLSANLHGFVPPSLDEGRGNELGTEVGFAQRLFAHHVFFNMTLD